MIQHPQRDRLQKMLGEAGIGTLIHYPVPCHSATAFQHFEFEKERFPIAEKLAETVLSLPVGPQQSETSTEYVFETAKSIFDKLAC